MSLIMRYISHKILMCMHKIDTQSPESKSQNFLTSTRSKRQSQKSIAKQNQLINAIQHSIMEYTGNLNNYVRRDIEISQGQFSTTYFIKGRDNQDITFYMGHGFGGSSLMYFPIFNSYLEKGNVLVWEVRGMGVGVKNKYPNIEDDKINQFYVEGLKKVIDFHDHKKIVFVSHSLSAYVTLRYLMEYPSDGRIMKAVLLSPVGITARQRDDRNEVKSCAECLNALVNSFGWKFRLTFKSPLRTLLCCFRKKILKKAFSQFSFSSSELQILVQLFETLVDLPDGSENIFFRYFLPRVLPRQGQSIEQLMEKCKIDKKISIYYGGEQDWVDKKGAEALSKSQENFKVEVFRSGGHMICLHKDLMKHILDGEIR